MALAVIVSNLAGSLTTIVCAFFGCGVVARFGALVLSALRSIVIIAFDRSGVARLLLGFRACRHLMTSGAHAGNRVPWYTNLDLIILGDGAPDGAWQLQRRRQLRGDPWRQSDGSGRRGSSQD